MLSDDDLLILQESALAMAQSTIENAMRAAKITRAELAARMGRPRSYITKMLSGEHNLTVKTFALALAAAGFEMRFTRRKAHVGFVKKER